MPSCPRRKKRSCGTISSSAPLTPYSTPPSIAERAHMFRFSPRPNRAHLVKWRPWGAEAFQEAQQQDKPLALWLTAFWCGYCQRMDDATLSNDEVIALLNAFFVAIRIEE